MVITSSAVIIRGPRHKLWKRLGHQQRFLFIYVPLSIIIIWSLLLYILLAHKKENVCPNKLPLKHICSTPGCIETTARMLNYMDQSIDPCDNLYQFACGGYIKNAHIENDKNKSNIATQLNRRVEYELREMFERPITDNDLRPFVLLKQLYQNCMNETTNDESDVIKAMLDDMGGWPILKGNDWNQHKFDWQKSIYKFRKYGLSINAFVSIDVADDPRNASKKILHIDVATVEFGPKSLHDGFKENSVQTYSNSLVMLATLFGADREFAKSEIQNLIDFEINLSEIKSVDNVEHEYRSIQELQKEYPSIVWLDLINYAVFLPDKALKEGDYISITNLLYIRNLHDLINKTSKRVLANHAIFQAVISLLPYLKDDFSFLSKKFASNGDEPELPRWKECVIVTSKSMKIATGSLYVRTYFNIEHKRMVTELAESIKNEAIKNLVEIALLKEEFLEKVKAIQVEVGYPDELLDDNEIENYYDDFKTNTDGYLLFMGNLSLFNDDKKYRKLFEPTNNSDLLETFYPMEVSIKYSAQKNNLQMPAAILQEGLFNNDRLNSINYGGIGSFIGQALVQTIVDIAGLELTKEREITCLSGQLPKVTLLDASKFAQNGVSYPLGLKYALLAYESVTAQNKLNSQLVGLNYTEQQLFWISATNSQCEKLRGAIISAKSVNGAPDTISELFSNFNNFEYSFNCKKNNVSSSKNCRLL